MSKRNQTTFKLLVTKVEITKNHYVSFQDYIPLPLPRPERVYAPTPVRKPPPRAASPPPPPKIVKPKRSVVINTVPINQWDQGPINKETGRPPHRTQSLNPTEYMVSPTGLQRTGRDYIGLPPPHVLSPTSNRSSSVGNSPDSLGSDGRGNLPIDVIHYRQGRRTPMSPWSSSSLASPPIHTNNTMSPMKRYTIPQRYMYGTSPQPSSTFLHRTQTSQANDVTVVGSWATGGALSVQVPVIKPANMLRV